MSFYIFDDLRETSLQTEKNPNAQYTGKWCDALPVEELTGDYEKCPICDAPVSRLRWLEPHKISLSNTKYPDRLSWWIKDPAIISDRVKIAYEKEGILGIKKFAPVNITKVAHMKASSPKPPQYFATEINYTLNVRVDVENSIAIGQRDDRLCALCNPFGITRDQIVKISLNTTMWKGEDIFKVYSLGVVVSQKFYDIVQKYNFSNFNLVSVDKYQKKLDG